MEEALRTLFIAGGGTAAWIAATVWLARSLLIHLANKDIEKYKADLKANNDLDLEGFKADLKAVSDRELESHKAALKATSDKELEVLRSRMSIQLLEHEVRFRRLHDKVAETIAETFTRLTKTYDSVARYVSPVDLAGQPDKDGKLVILGEHYNEFSNYLSDNRLFLPRHLYKTVLEFRNKLYDVSMSFKWGLQGQKAGRAGDVRFWTEADTTFKEEITPLYDKIHIEFQSILGFERAPDPE